MTAYQRVFKHRHFNVGPQARKLKPEEVEERIHGAPLPDQNKPLSAGAIEARRLLEEANRKFKEQQTMPDIKTALSTAISKWEEPAKEQSSNPLPANAFKVTNDVTRATFNAVRENPHKYTATELCNYMETKGFNPRSVSSLVYQLTHAGQLGKDDKKRFYALVNEYTPIKIRRAKAKAKPVAKPKLTRHEAVEKAVAAAPAKYTGGPISNGGMDPRNAPAPTKITAQQVLETLSVKQAHALYLELRSIFG